MWHYADIVGVPLNRFGFCVFIMSLFLEYHTITHLTYQVMIG